MWERCCCFSPSLHPYQQPWQQQRDPAPPFVARKTFNCLVVIGEKWEDPQGGHCLGNSMGLQAHTLSIPSLYGWTHLGCSRKESVCWGLGMETQTSHLGAGHCQLTDFTIAEALRGKKAGPWLCLAGHRVERRGFAGASRTKPE